MSYEILQSCLSDYRKTVYQRKLFLYLTWSTTTITGLRFFGKYVMLSLTPVILLLFYLHLSSVIFFRNSLLRKMSVLRSSITTPTDHDPPIPPMRSAVLDQFEPISISSLSKVVHHLQPTNCTSDSVPAHLPKEVFDTVSPCILSLINTCLLFGCVPAAF